MLKAVSSITNAIGALNYKGTWDASTNTPTLVSATGTKGDYYVVSVAGTTTIDGISIWGVGDSIVFNGAAWQRTDGGTTGNFTDVTASGSIDTTSIEVTNIKAKDGTASATIANTTGVMTLTSPVLTTPTLGTPSSGTVTNLTGTASININGTVGATTPTTGSFTTVTGSSDASINGLTVGRGAGNSSANTVVGMYALASNTTGNYNTVSGTNALLYNTTGYNNTANGVNALYYNTTGSQNIASGVNALLYNTTGYNNTADGVNALRNNTAGYSNTATGVNSLYSNTTASNNTATGMNALLYNTTGDQNAASGVNSLYYNTTGYYNTAVGTSALYANRPTSKAITAFADAGGGNVTVTSTAHGRSNGNSIAITGTTNYNGNFTVANATTDTFTIVDTWVANDATGWWGYASEGQLNTAIGYNSGSAITTGSKNTIIGSYTGNQGGLDIRTASNHIVLSDGDGNPLVSTTVNGSLALQGATPATGTGIAFPATQYASSNANTLDDYEEGTWTPTFGSFDGTYSVQLGTYTKIGRLVTVEVHLAASSIGTSAGNSMSVGNFPFTKLAGSVYGASSSVHGTSWATPKTSPNILLPGSSTVASVYITMFSGASGFLPNYADIGTSGNLLFSMTYMATS